MTAFIQVSVRADVPIGQSNEAARRKVADYIEKALLDRRSGLWPLLNVTAVRVQLVEPEGGYQDAEP